MSGVAGGHRIDRANVKATTDRYISDVLSGFAPFRGAEISGSYNTTGRDDFGDIDLIVHLDSDDKKSIKKDLQKYLESRPQAEILPFTSEKYTGKRSYNSGEIISILYPQVGHDRAVQIDNIIALDRDETVFKKNFLDMPAETQGLIMGLVKTAIQEATKKRKLPDLFARIGLQVPSTDKKLEFTLSGVNLSLRAYEADENGREVKGTRETLWNSNRWTDTVNLLSDYNLRKPFEELLDDAKATLKHPTSKQRVKGLFTSMVSIKSGEVGTAKAERKQDTIDMVNAMEKYTFFRDNILTEGKAFHNRSWSKNLSMADVVNLTACSLVLLYVLGEEGDADAKKYTRKLYSSYPNFTQVSISMSDLYTLISAFYVKAHMLDDNTYELLKPKALPAWFMRKYLTKIALGDMSNQDAITFFYRIKSMFRVQNNNVKQALSLAQRYNKLDPNSKHKLYQLLYGYFNVHGRIMDIFSTVRQKYFNSFDK